MDCGSHVLGGGCPEERPRLAKFWLLVVVVAVSFFLLFSVPRWWLHRGETRIGKLLLVVDVFFVCFLFCMKMPRVCGSHVLDGGSPEEKPGLAKLPRASVQAVTSPTNCHARYRPALD